MKKLLMLLVVLNAAFFIFPQTDKYNALIYNADRYSSEEHWVYAMGSYADAIAEDPVHAKEAFDKFNEIANNILQGIPGLENYPEEELYYRWKNILTEAEIYWTENCPYNITIGPLELKSENSKSASYWADINIKFSDKYILIMNLIEQGYKTSYNHSWDLPIPVFEYSSEGYRYCSSDDCWPRVSATKGNSTQKGNVYSLTTEPEDFRKNNVATLGFSSNGPKDYEPRFEHGKHLKIFTDKAIAEFYNAFAFHEPQDIFCNTLYEAKITLTAENGEDVTPPSTFVLRHSFDSDEPCFKFEINDIPDDQRENYDNGYYYPVIYDFKLHYGFQSSEMYNKPKGEKFFFTESEILELPSIKLNDESIKIYYSQNGEKDRFIAFYLSNYFRDRLTNSLNENISEYKTDKGYEYYLSDFLYSDDYIEITDIFDSTYRVPLWIFANYSSDLFQIPAAYDNFGNQINDQGFVVSLNETNEYFTLKLKIEMPEELNTETPDEPVEITEDVPDEIEIVEKANSDKIEGITETEDTINPSLSEYQITTHRKDSEKFSHIKKHHSKRSIRKHIIKQLNDHTL